MSDSDSVLPPPSSPPPAHAEAARPPATTPIPPPPPPPAPPPAAPPAPSGVGYMPGPAPVQETVKQAGAALPARSIREMEAVCVDAVRRTHDTSTLYFFVGDPGPYKAGQFITIDPHQFPELARWIDYLELMKGKREGIRAYSMSSIPGEKCISITVKAEEYTSGYHKFPPLLSPFLASGALKGREVVIKGFSGSYVLPDDLTERTDQVLHLVAGSGIVPNYALLKDELRKPERAKVKHTMVFVNKTLGDIIFHDQLRALAKAFPDRFDMHFLVTREDPTHLGPMYKQGRPTVELIQGLVRDPSSVLVYACGAAISKWDRERAKEQGEEPKPRFMETVNEIVSALGIDRSRYKKEVFG